MTLKPVLDAFAGTPAVRDLAERLPARGETLRLGGLPGSSGAVLAAWLVQTFPQRLLTIVAPTPADAERWLTDLGHLTDEPTALYPQREALGEDEPHYEIAGERAEAIQALLQGRLRVLVTTARATAERTLLPGGARSPAPHAGRGRAASTGGGGPRARDDGLHAGCRPSPRWPSSACAAAFWTCTASAWPARPGWSGGETTSHRCVDSI